MKKTLLLFIISFFAISFTWSQNGYYETYEDYESGHIVKMSRLLGASQGGSVTFLNGGKKVALKEGKVWGFIAENMLFRGIKDKDLFAAVVFKNEKVVVYANGYAYADMIARKTNSSVFAYGFSYYISLDLNSPIVPIFSDGYINTKVFMKFQEENPQFKEFYDCLPSYGTIFTNENFKPCFEILKGL